MTFLMNEISSNNYDLVVKEALSLFYNRSLSFLGLDLPVIVHELDTEFAEVITTNERLDLVFLLANNMILHLEEEAHLSEGDLLRFAQYDIRLYRKHKKKVLTVVLTPASGTSGTKEIDIGTLQYTVTQVVLSACDGDELLEKMLETFKRGETPNELELIFLPLMQSMLTPHELLRRVIILEKGITDTNIRLKVQILTLVFANRIVDRETLDELWEELAVFKVFKYAEERGIEKGMEKGMEKVAKNLISRGLEDEFIMEVTGLKKDVIESLKRSITPSH